MYTHHDCIGADCGSVVRQLLTKAAQGGMLPAAVTVVMCMPDAEWRSHLQQLMSEAVKPATISLHR